MPYVERHADGAIKGVYANPQPGYAEEWCDFAELPPPPPEAGNALPLVLQALHSRIEALEGRSFAEDEDPGEQPEIFTEEDVEALGAVAVAVAVEGEAVQEDDRPADTEAPPELGTSGGVFYPGIMPLRNELEDLRSDVIRAISDQKRMRLRIAMDPSRADFLSERFAQYNNAGALGIEPDEGLIADRNAFLAMQSQERAINAFALSLEDAAATADEAKLRAMHAGLGDGWP